MKLRYQIRTMLIVVSALGIWLGWKVNQAHQQRRAVTRLQSVGAFVAYDFQYKSSGIFGSAPDFQATSPFPAFFRSIFGDDMFASVAYVQLDNDAATNDDLRCLSGLPHLKTLFISSEGISADGLSILRTLQELEDLSIGIQISDADLDHLAQLKSLKELYLMGPSPDGYVLRSRSKSQRVYDTDFYNSQITHAAVERLSKELPSCHISY